MAVDMFLILNGISGESQDDTYEGEIDILAWSWGVSQSGTTHMGTGSGSGKANFQDIAITKWVDKATPELLKHCSTGKHIPDGEIIVRKAGDQPLEYLKIKMTDILVTSYTTGGSGGEDRLTENLSLNFREFEEEYVPQKSDGSGGEAVRFGYNIARNAPA